MGLQVTVRYISLQNSVISDIHSLLSFIQRIPPFIHTVITNLASCFGALSQTTLIISVCEVTFDVLVQSPIYSSRLLRMSQFLYQSKIKKKRFDNYLSSISHVQHFVAFLCGVAHLSIPFRFPSFLLEPRRPQLVFPASSPVQVREWYTAYLNNLCAGYVTCHT